MAMQAKCRCGTDVEHAYDQLGCIQCGANCCPACSHELESVNYCSNCAAALLDLPWAVTLYPARHAAGIL